MLQCWIRQPRFRADRSASHCASRPCTGDNFRMRTLILAGRGFRTQRQAYDGPVRRTNSIDTICTHTTAAAYVLGAASRTPECDICFTSCIRILKSFVLNVEIHNDEFGVLDFNLWVWHSMWHATWNISETNEKLPCKVFPAGTCHLLSRFRCPWSALTVVLYALRSVCTWPFSTLDWKLLEDRIHVWLILAWWCQLTLESANFESGTQHFICFFSCCDEQDYTLRPAIHEVFLVPFHRRGNWGAESSNNWFRGTEFINVGVSIHTYFSLTQESVLWRVKLFLMDL